MNKLQLTEDLAKLIRASEKEVCDAPGYGAQAISSSQALAAQTFLSSLRATLPPPELGYEATGDVAFDWVLNRHRLLSVTVGENGLIYAMLLENPDENRAIRKHGVISGHRMTAELEAMVRQVCFLDDKKKKSVDSNLKTLNAG